MNAFGYVVERMFRRRWFSANHYSLKYNTPYWAVVFAAEKKLGESPVEVKAGRSGYELDRLYMFDVWSYVKLRYWLAAIGSHPVFANRR